MKSTTFLLLVVLSLSIISSKLFAQRMIGAAGITLSGTISNNGTILPPTTGGNYTYYLPSFDGTLLTSGALGQFVWVLGGNTSPSSTILGNLTTNGNLNLYAGAERMTLDGTSGFIGINKTTPDHQLDIYRFVDPTGTFLQYSGIQVVEEVTPSPGGVFNGLFGANHSVLFTNSAEHVDAYAVGSSGKVITDATFDGTIEYVIGGSTGIDHYSGHINEALGIRTAINVSDGATMGYAGVLHSYFSNYGGTINHVDLISTSSINVDFTAPATIGTFNIARLSPPYNQDFGSGASITNLNGLVIDDLTTPWIVFTPPINPPIAINYADKFVVEGINGDLSKIKSVSYSWPATQASSVGQVLTNNGAGSLSWMSPTSTLVYGEVSPATLNANTNDYNIITTSGTYYRLSSSVDIDLTGLTGGSAGRFIILANTGNNFIVLKDDDPSSAVGNRFQMAGAGNDITIAPEGTVGLIYDGADGVWRVVSMF